MGYRDSFLRNPGAVTRQYESTLFAFEKEIRPTHAVNLLEAGVENGGSLDVWRDCLPAGSTVTGIDIDPRVAEYTPGVLIGDVLDKSWLKTVLEGQTFEVIIDDTRSYTPWLWPYLTPGGVYAVLVPDSLDVTDLVYGLQDSLSTWLPSEEIIRLGVYEHVVVVEKRHPKVVDTLEVFTGNFAEVMPEKELFARGAKRVII